MSDSASYKHGAQFKSSQVTNVPLWLHPKGHSSGMSYLGKVPLLKHMQRGVKSSRTRPESSLGACLGVRVRARMLSNSLRTFREQVTEVRSDQVRFSCTYLPCWFHAMQRQRLSSMAKKMLFKPHSQNQVASSCILTSCSMQEQNSLAQFGGLL